MAASHRCTGRFCGWRSIFGLGGSCCKHFGFQIWGCKVSGVKLLLKQYVVRACLYIYINIHIYIYMCVYIIYALRRAEFLQIMQAVKLRQRAKSNRMTSYVLCILSSTNEEHRSHAASSDSARGTPRSEACNCELPFFNVQTFTSETSSGQAALKVHKIKNRVGHPPNPFPEHLTLYLPARKDPQGPDIIVGEGTTLSKVKASKSTRCFRAMTVSVAKTFWPALRSLCRAWAETTLRMWPRGHMACGTHKKLQSCFRLRPKGWELVSSWASVLGFCAGIPGFGLAESLG